MSHTVLVRNVEGLKLSRTCSVTKEEYVVVVVEEDYDRWMLGTLAQDAFPYLNRDQLEFMISGTTPAEWTKMLPPEENELDY